MLKKRENPAERVRDLVELLHVRRHTGLLSIERFESGRFEEGEIYLEDGHPAYARCGKQEGEGAFAYMLGWRNVYFAFEKDDAAPVASGGNLAADSLFSQKATRPMSLRSTLPLSGLEQLVPRRRQSEQPALSLPLSRLQRSVYLLVDGRRTVSDLARCIGRNILEVRQVLGELELQKLIDL